MHDYRVGRKSELITIRIPKGAVLTTCGDSHGVWDRMRTNMEPLPKGSTVIHLGDFGIGFYHAMPKDEKAVDKALNDLNSWLGEQDITLYVLRGNHDNPVYFQSVTHLRSRIIMLPDFTRLEMIDEATGRKSIGIIYGGAVSIDRKNRTPFKNWWAMELPTDGGYDDILAWIGECISSNKYLTLTVFAHDVPLPMVAYRDIIGDADSVRYWQRKDGALHEDMQYNTSVLLTLAEEIALTVESNGGSLMNWFHGHFHKNATYAVDKWYFASLEPNLILDVMHKVFP